MISIANLLSATAALPPNLSGNSALSIVLAFLVAVLGVWVKVYLKVKEKETKDNAETANKDRKSKEERALRLNSTMEKSIDMIRELSHQVNLQSKAIFDIIKMMGEDNNRASNVSAGLLKIMEKCLNGNKAIQKEVEKISKRTENNTRLLAVIEAKSK